MRHRFGERAITRARLVGARLPAPFERDPMTPVDVRTLDVDATLDVDPDRGSGGDDIDGPPEDRDSQDVTATTEDRFDGA